MMYDDGDKIPVAREGRDLTAWLKMAFGVCLAITVTGWTAASIQREPNTWLGLWFKFGSAVTGIAVLMSLYRDRIR